MRVFRLVVVFNGDMKDERCIEKKNIPPKPTNSVSLSYRPIERSP